MLDRLRSTYFYICWLPLALYVASDIYIATSTGWGQWAMGVVVLPPMLLSAAFMLVGVMIVSDMVRQGGSIIKIALATLVAGSVFLWFVGRTLLVTLNVLP